MMGKVVKGVFNAESLSCTIVGARFLTEMDAATSRVERAPRSHYLGMSSIGKCQAELWRRFNEGKRGGNAQTEVEPRIQRIFDLGNAIEDDVVRIVHCMEGVEVISEQQSYEDFDGQFRGHSDLVLRLPEFAKVVPDVKSMNNMRFRQFEELGVRMSNWDYYAQLTMYAGYEGAQAIMTIAYNKDTSALAVEIVPFNEEDFKIFKAKAKMILESKKIPPCEKGKGKVRWCSCRN